MKTCGFHNHDSSYLLFFDVITHGDYYSRWLYHGDKSDRHFCLHACRYNVSARCMISGRQKCLSLLSPHFFLLLHLKDGFDFHRYIHGQLIDAHSGTGMHAGLT